MYLHPPSPLPRLLTWACLICLFASALDARPGEADTGPSRIDPLNAAEAQAFLERLRTQRLQNDFIFEFVFVHLPHRGDSRMYQGELWGAWHHGTPVLRASISPDEAGEESVPSAPLELLLHAGSQPEIWRKDTAGKVRPIIEADWSQPILEGLTYSAYDLGLPFLYWSDTRYDDSRRFRGRPVHFFRAYPPGDQRHSVQGRTIGYVEMAVDTDFFALLRARFYSEDGVHLRTLNINGFKQLDSEQYIIRSIDLVDETTREKTRFNVIGANDQVNLDPAIFAPERFAGSKLNSASVPMERW